MYKIKKKKNKTGGTLYCDNFYNLYKRGWLYWCGILCWFEILHSYQHVYLV